MFYVALNHIIYILHSNSFQVFVLSTFSLILISSFPHFSIWFYGNKISKELTWDLVIFCFSSKRAEVWGIRTERQTKSPGAIYQSRNNHQEKSDGKQATLEKVIRSLGSISTMWKKSSCDYMITQKLYKAYF